MNTATINIKTDPKIKAEAQLIAKELGFSLSSIVNAHLRNFVRTGKVSFSINNEEPSEYLIQALKESEADRKAGRFSTFDTPEEAISHFKSLSD